ncbi:MAG TPA: hypothetical protein VFX94_05095 [Burkholderiales bacterium]|nr:hypothetical protein [Burkholderiales bacterium]
MGAPALELGRRAYAFATRPDIHGDAYVDPDTWAAQTPREHGSWWPQWQRSLSERSGAPVEPPFPGRSRGAAFGHYVPEH